MSLESVTKPCVSSITTLAARVEMSKGNIEIMVDMKKMEVVYRRWTQDNYTGWPLGAIGRMEWRGDENWDENWDEDCDLSSLLLSRVCWVRRSGRSWANHLHFWRSSLIRIIRMTNLYSFLPGQKRQAIPGQGIGWLLKILLLLTFWHCWWGNIVIVDDISYMVMLILWYCWCRDIVDAVISLMLV